MTQKVNQAGQALQEDYTYFEKQLNLSSTFEKHPECGGGQTEPETPYWFHPDHLGSSSYISNKNKEISQHLEYFPFGETLVEEHKNSNNSPYKFNAKELDDETGNYYYGARYYSSKYNLMLSVDPASEMYPSFSPYAYTLQNPVKYVDPTGMVVEDPPTERGGKSGSTHYDRDNTELYFWNNEREVWYGDKGNRVSFRNENDIDGISFWSRFGWQNLGLNKGTSSVSIDVEELNILGGNPLAGYQSKVSAILGLVATILNPASGSLSEKVEKPTKPNKGLDSNSLDSKFYVNENIEFSTIKIGNHKPVFHRQETSHLKTVYDSKASADSSINVRKQDSNKVRAQYQKILDKYENSK